MPVRDLTSEDFLSYKTLTAGAFGGPFDPTSADSPRDFSPGQIALGIDSPHAPGAVAAGARIRRDRIALGGAVADCGGIAGLAVHPAHRGDGLFRELVPAVLARCTAEGMPWTMLFPSNPTIYRRFGYQVIARCESLIVPLLDLQRLPAVPGRRLVPVTEATMPRVRALYEELTAEDNAMLRRDTAQFPPGLPPHPWAAVLLRDEAGVDCGYVSWSRRRADQEPVGLEVHELLGRSREDRQALLRSLGSWSTVTSEVRLRIRADDPVLDVLPGSGARPDPGPVPLVMMRVLDTAAALRLRHAPAHAHGELRLEIEDTTVPAGATRAAGLFHVSVADGAVRVRETKGAEGTAGRSSLPTVRLDVHAASLLLVGGRTVADPRRAGLRAEADPSAEGLLDALLAGPRPSVLDSF